MAAKALLVVSTAVILKIDLFTFANVLVSLEISSFM